METLRIEVWGGNNYGLKSVTTNGETVRSFSEKKIADYFQKNKINYQYERSGDYYIHNPDFYLPDYDLYVEFWGLVKAEDNWTRENYIRNMKRKMAIYHKRHKHLVNLYPDNLENLDWIFRAKFRKEMGYELNS